MTPLYQFLERPDVFNAIVTGMVCFVVGAWVQAWVGKREGKRGKQV